MVKEEETWNQKKLLLKSEKKKEGGGGPPGKTQSGTWNVSGGWRGRMGVWSKHKQEKS